MPQPTGPAAQLLIAAAWPGMSESALADLAGEQQALANAANAYGDQVMRDLTQQRELLKGAAGDAHGNRFRSNSQFGSTTGALVWRGSAGTVTTIAPA